MLLVFPHRIGSGSPAVITATRCATVVTDLDLKFQYRGRTMGSQTVSNPQGCRLYYGHLEPTPDQVDLFGPVTLQQVQFPGTSDIQNQKQRQYTETVLGVMERGLILEIWEQDIYAVRLCQSKVFWSGPGIPEQGPPNPMEREERVKVFSLNHFLEGDKCERHKFRKVSSDTNVHPQDSSCSRKEKLQTHHPLRFTSVLGRTGPTRNPRRRNSSWSRFVTQTEDQVKDSCQGASKQQPLVFVLRWFLWLLGS